MLKSERFGESKGGAEAKFAKNYLVLGHIYTCIYP